MPYFRVQYEGYIEGDYESQEDAVEAFLEVLEYGDLDLDVEVFDEETKEWEPC